jgi:small GTP-binding protein
MDSKSNDLSEILKSMAASYKKKEQERLELDKNAPKKTAPPTPSPGGYKTQRRPEMKTSLQEVLSLFDQREKMNASRAKIQLSENEADLDRKIIQALAAPENQAAIESLLDQEAKTQFRISISNLLDNPEDFLGSAPMIEDEELKSELQEALNPRRECIVRNLEVRSMFSALRENNIKLKKELAHLQKPVLIRSSTRFEEAAAVFRLNFIVLSKILKCVELEWGIHPPSYFALKHSEKKHVKQRKRFARRTGMKVVQTKFQRNQVDGGGPVGPGRRSKRQVTFIYDRDYLISADIMQSLCEEMALDYELVDDSVKTNYDMVSRPPIITVVGHVNHGKTTLLDYFRAERDRIAPKEAGGITQSIGSFQVGISGDSSDQKKLVTFFDTPGHSLFTSMRENVAKVTDIIILVVAADDGVNTQTREAIKLIQLYNLPCVVAINKCDIDGVDTDFIREQLTDEGLHLDDDGGDVFVVEISAKSGLGLSDLQEALLLVSEMHEMSSAVNAPAELVVVETQLKKGQGHLVHAVVRHGILRTNQKVLINHTPVTVSTLFDVFNSF